MDKKCDECDGSYYAKNKCVKHYFKSRRKTTRELIPEGAECTVEGCTKPMRCKKMCRYHYDVDRGYRKPSPNAGIGRGKVKKDMVGYRAAHIRVEQVKGKASTHDCVRCGNPAQEWALDPTAVHTYEDEQGRVWSMNVDDYYPMCCSCHRRLDKQPDLWFVDQWLDAKVVAS